MHIMCVCIVGTRKKTFLLDFFGKKQYVAVIFNVLKTKIEKNVFQIYTSILQTNTSTIIYII